MTIEAPSIADQVRHMEEGMAGKLPADAAQILNRYQDELVAHGVPDTVVGPGFVLPDVDLVDAHGAPTSLHEQLDGQPAVIVFYRGAWCPYCNVALRTYQQQLLPQLIERSVRLIALSPQLPDGSLDMEQKHELKFPVLSDPGNSLARRLGILLPPRPADVERVQSTLGLDLEAVNADGTDALPMPTVVVADHEGVLRWIDVHPNYATRTEVVDIVAALDEVRPG